MSTILESLRSVNAYPVPLSALLLIACGRGIEPDTETTEEVLAGKAYNLAVADILLWLSFAPDISQGGQSYSFTDEQRLQMRNRARTLQDRFMDEEEKAANKPAYGYKGSRL